MDGIDLKFRRLAFGPLLEGDEKEPRVGACDGAQEVEADDRGHILDARGLQKNLLDALGGLGGLLERGGARKLHDAEEVALILLGDECGGHGAADPAGSQSESDKENDSNTQLSNQAPADGDIAVRGGVEHFIEASEEGTKWSPRLLARAQQKRTQSRAE